MNLDTLVSVIQSPSIVLVTWKVITYKNGNKKHGNQTKAMPGNIEKQTQKDNRKWFDIYYD